ncbi:hypothetical protein NPIL_341491 [Nephila pilipes]|uniref:Uncharacterized protein n=1 Tax=Nephila pilipes TaxID=299642 RepID=A0A8X6MWS4_NEPPI|nr:hypothetical protein NPIL_341491 [Nephila pilipes]
MQADVFRNITNMSIGKGIFPFFSFYFSSVISDEDDILFCQFIESGVRYGRSGHDHYRPDPDCHANAIGMMQSFPDYVPSPPRHPCQSHASP